MEVVTHTPVFKYNNNDKTVRWDRNLAIIYGYIDSTFTKMGADTIQWFMDRRAGIYASFDRFSAFKTYLSHFNKQTIEIDDDDVVNMPFIGMYVEKDDYPIPYDGSYPIRSFEDPLSKVNRRISLHFYNQEPGVRGQLAMAQSQYHWVLKNWLDAMNMLEYGIIPPYFSDYQTEEWAQNTVSFFDIVYRGKTPVDYNEYEIVDLDKKKKRGDSHYVYTLSYDGVVVYVGYTASPKNRMSQHIYYQTNKYLKHAIDAYGVPDMQVVKKFSNMDDALGFETQLICEYGEKTTLANVMKNPYGGGYI